MKKILLGFFLMVLLAGQSAATSLYEESEYTSLVSDRIARKVGDNVTILIYESTAASASANADTQKETGVAVGVVDTTEPENRSLGIESTFAGGGDLTRSGNMLARITATVVSIGENGELRIEGQQHIEMNEDIQTIELSGTLRQEDIGPNNTVISTRLSDAKIKYLAEGTLADRQKPGWITRFFNWIY
jgi:flagellar L-ring protein precursor FlgH